MSTGKTTTTVTITAENSVLQEGDLIAVGETITVPVVFAEEVIRKGLAKPAGGKATHTTTGRKGDKPKAVSKDAAPELPDV